MGGDVHKNIAGAGFHVQKNPRDECQLFGRIVDHGCCEWHPNDGRAGVRGLSDGIGQQIGVVQRKRGMAVRPPDAGVRMVLTGLNPLNFEKVCALHPDAECRDVGLSGSGFHYLPGVTVAG